MDKKRIVREGYNQAAEKYLERRHEDLEEMSLEELIAYYRFSGTGLYISIPVRVPENN